MGIHKVSCYFHKFHSIVMPDQGHEDTTSQFNAEEFILQRGDTRSVDGAPVVIFANDKVSFVNKGVASTAGAISRVSIESDHVRLINRRHGEVNAEDAGVDVSRKYAYVATVGAVDELVNGMVDGGAGNADLVGGRGSDTLAGGSSNDWLTGGHCRVVFVVTKADDYSADRTIDFAGGNDRLDASDFGFNDLEATTPKRIYSGTLATFADNNSVTLVDVDADQMSAQEIIL